MGELDGREAEVALGLAEGDDLGVDGELLDFVSADGPLEKVVEVLGFHEARFEEGV